MVDRNIGLGARIAGVFFAFAHEQLVVSDSAKILTASKYQKTVADAAPAGNRTVVAQRAVITVEDQDIRYTYDGTTPTTDVGHLATAGTTITIVGPKNIENFKAFRDGATDSEINVTYEL